MNNKNASYVKIGKAFGFNRHQLTRWRFGPENVVLCFTDGQQEVLTGADRETFRNWAETVAEAAPETHQYTLFERERGS